ncbi:RHS repeat-associated core domain-containing protein [Dentiradicibacter hellwigii]|uniref:RHS repeat-associated core domain-containing protein n=1 Tax=Dentiradicibacter hellwigii TaxID=3149053 RepID=A0ABV4UGP9_9RHOO
MSGSSSVLIGDQGAVACSVCPGGLQVGAPVNPQLGAKVLVGEEEQDFALPGALSLIWQRHYSSYVNAEQGGACGLFGYGWKSALELSLHLDTNGVSLFDSAGRILRFPTPLHPGEALYSPSEDIYLLRGGQAGPESTSPAQAPVEGHGVHHFGESASALQPRSPIPVASATLPAARTAHADTSVIPIATENASPLPAWHSQSQWHHVPVAWAGSDNHIIASDSDGRILWHFTPGEAGYWRLVTRRDLIGREQKILYAEDLPPEQRTLPLKWQQQRKPADRVDLPGHLPCLITDGTGRRYRLHYTCLDTRAAAAWQQEHERRLQALARGEALPRPPTGPGHNAQAGWQQETGIRLERIDWENPPTGVPLPLVRYVYDRAGDLIGVHDRSGRRVREFAYAAHLMSAHRYRGGPWHRYRYEGQAEASGTPLPGARVIEQHNEQGLNYRFTYLSEPPSPDGQMRQRTEVTDSLGRQDIYRFTGSGGLSRLTEHQRADGSIERMEYDSFGRLTALTDPLGGTRYLRRDGQGRITGLQGPEGSYSRARYDDAGQLAETTDEAGRTTRYAYDAFGRLSRIHQQGADQDEEAALTTHYHYPDPQNAPLTAHLPVSIIDARGGIRHLAYNAAGQLVGHTDCSGQRTAYAYDLFGALTEETDALGQRTAYRYDEAGQLTETCLPDGSRLCQQWNDFGQITRLWQQDAHDQAVAGSETRLCYDLWGRLVERRHGGQRIGMHYDEAGRLIELTNENGAVSRFAYDLMDRLIEETGFDGRVQRYQYDAAGHLIAHHDGEGRRHCYQWNKAGYLTRILSSQHGSQGTVQRIAHLHYDKAGALNRVTHALQQPGQETPRLCSELCMAYDSLGRLTGETQRLYAQSNFATDGAPPPVEYEHAIRHTLNPLGRRTASEQAICRVDYLRYGAGHLHGLLLNGEEVLSLERDALHRETRRRYKNGAERIQTFTLRGQTEGEHWQLGNAASIPAPLIGQLYKRRYQYDALGQLTGLTQGQTHPQVLHYAYDASGRLIGETGSGPSGRALHWHFDPAGNRLPWSHPGEAAGGRTYAQSHPQSQFQPQPQQPQLQSQLQSQSLLRAAGQSPVRTHLPHVPSDPMMAPVQIEGEGATAGSIACWPDNRIGHSDEAAYRYDAQGNRIGADSLKEGGRQELFYDVDNRLIEVRQFDAHGRPAYTSIYRYDPFGRRLSQTVIAYETTTTQTARPGEETRPARQTRTETSAPIINEQTAYGRDGDLQETQTLQASQAPQALQSSHRQTMQTAQAPQTPPAPTETTRTTYYGWDGDHLVQIKSPTGTTHIVYEDEYSFTPLIELYQPACAQPEEQSEAQEAIARVMNSLAQLGSEEVRELQQQIKAQAESILRQGGLREEEDEGEREGKHEGEGKHARASNALQIRYFHCNQIGAPLALTDDKGQVIWAARYDPWGNIEEAFNADPEHFEQTLRLPGQQHDKATGLYYNRHRFYDPRLGAYISQDPIGLDGGINLSSYVRNPVQWMDPWGLFSVADLPIIPGPILDFTTAIADSASFGLGPLARQAMGIDGGVNRCSKAYLAGEWASFGLGAGRMVYAGIAKVGAAIAMNGAAAMTFRNGLKRVMRGPLAGSNYRIKTYEDLLNKYGTDEAIQAAAGRTNQTVNAVGANLTGGGSVNITCGCP